MAAVVPTREQLAIIDKWISAGPGDFVVDLDDLYSLTGHDQFRSLTDQLKTQDLDVKYKVFRGIHTGNKPVYMLQKGLALELLTKFKTPRAVALLQQLVNLMCTPRNPKPTALILDHHQHPPPPQQEQQEQQQQHQTYDEIVWAEDNACVLYNPTHNATKGRIEKAVSDNIAKKVGGRREVVIDTGRVDVVSSTHAIEVKNIVQWKDAMGYALAYSTELGLLPHVHLFYVDARNFQRLSAVITKIVSGAFNIMLTFEHCQVI